MITFEYPYMAFLLIVPFLIRLFKKRSFSQKSRALKVPFVKDIKNIENASSHFASFQKTRLFNKSFLGLLFCYTFVVISLMYPVRLSEPEQLKVQGRDILLVTDISTSMLEEDFAYRGQRLSRMEAVRAVVADFAKNRANDRMGLILFGTRAYLQVPLTFDKQALLDVLASMQAGMAGQTTSIGDAVALALKTLKNTKTNKDNQVIILLTDGENNDGQMSVPEAVKLAKDEGVKIYTVGIGSPQMSLTQAFFGIRNSGLDETTLKQLAEETKGRYFKVTTLKELIDVYRKIDLLEEQDLDDHIVYQKTPLYYIPLLIAFCSAFLLLLLGTLKEKLP